MCLIPPPVYLVILTHFNEETVAFGRCVVSISRPSGEEIIIISHNCFSSPPHFPVRLIKTNKGADIWTVCFAATAVRQFRVWGLPGLPAPLPCLRLGVRRLLPRQRPLLRVGRPELLSLLSHWKKVNRCGPSLWFAAVFVVPGCSCVFMDVDIAIVGFSEPLQALEKHKFRCFTCLPVD